MRKQVYLKKAVTIDVTALILTVACAVMLILPAGVQAMDISVRFGQGGFRDSRAPDNTIGGGQICLDLKFHDLPVIFTIGQEYYTAGPDPELDCEISSLSMCSACYTKALNKKWPVNFYLGGGLGLLKIPNGKKAAAIQSISRIDTKLFWKVYGYAEGKYLFSRKDEIDFSEAVFLLGFGLKFNIERSL